jgi:ribonuclease D
VLPPAVLRKQAERLLGLISAVAERDAAELPPALPRALGAEQRAQLKTLKEALVDRAGDLGVAPEILLPGADLELLVRERTGEAFEAPRRWSGWRAAAALEPLRQVPL